MSGVGIKFQLPPRNPNWVLTGEGGPLKLVAAMLIGPGVVIERLTPGVAYRVRGEFNELSKFSQQQSLQGLVKLELEGHDQHIELTTETVSPSSYPRTVTVTGEAFLAVTDAIDCGLIVSFDGYCRWVVTGRTSALAQWVAAASNKTMAEVLAIWGLTAEDVSAEDKAAGAPPISVILPARRTTSEISRDSNTGNILSIVQTESDV